jgi:hypothetical protein
LAHTEALLIAREGRKANGRAPNTQASVAIHKAEETTQCTSLTPEGITLLPTTGQPLLSVLLNRKE